jgi:hypothetical protein
VTDIGSRAYIQDQVTATAASSDVAGDVTKLGKIDWPDIEYNKAEKLGADAISNPALNDAIAANSDLAKAWGKMDDAGLEGLKGKSGSTSES